MTSHLHISVTYLQPTCHARLGKEDSAPNEWPPSPLRLFQAMVAGAAARWAGDGASTHSGGGALTAAAPVAALKWLESLCATSPPTILAPQAVTGQAIPRYVPNNSADLVASKWARGDSLATFEDRTKKVFRPTYLLGGSSVHYVWALNEEQHRSARHHEPTIAAAARCIVALGWGIDAAIGDARIIDESHANTLPGERWLPGRPGTPGHRLPIIGTLDALFTRHGAFLSRLKDGVFHPVPPLRAFGTTSYRRASDLQPRPFAAFILRPLDKDASYAAFPATQAIRVAAMLRHAAWNAAEADLDVDAKGRPCPDAWRTREWAEQFVAGHGPRGPHGRYVEECWPRFSYLPLPSIGHRHADGLIRRVIIAEPFGCDGRSARWAARRLANAHLVDKDSKAPVARLEPVELDEAEFARVFPLFVPQSNEKAAGVWTSVTPVILPRFPKARKEDWLQLLQTRQAENESQARTMALAHAQRVLLLECLSHAGIDPAAVTSIESRRSAWQPHGGGALTPPLSSFKRPNYLMRLPAIHVRLAFSRPISGPLAIGAGRHCGLGVCGVESLP